MIPLSVPSIKGNEWRYVKECLDTEWISSAGKFVDRFENEIVKYINSKYAIACVNGTAALHVALRSVGVKAEDEVIVPTVTFIAPVNAVRYLNAEPIFMDCDNYYNIDIEKIITFLKNHTLSKEGFTYNKFSNKRITAIIPVHIFGNAVDLENLVEICYEKNIKIVEDATESLGTKYISGRFAGKHAGTIGDIGCLSFNGNKIITTGGGGMIVTNNSFYAEKAKYLTTQAKNDEVKYIHNEIGYNYRLTNIQAALGVAQLEQLPFYLEIKKNNYIEYKNYINKIVGLILASTPDYANNNYWMYCLQINKKVYGKDKDELMKYLAEKKIETRPVWYLNHLQKPYQHCFNFKIEKAFSLYDITLNIPCSVNLTKSEIEKVVSFL